MFKEDIKIKVMCTEKRASFTIQHKYKYFQPHFDHLISNLTKTTTQNQFVRHYRRKETRERMFNRANENLFLHL